MPWDAVIVTLLLAIVLIAFVLDKIQPDVIALSVIAVLTLTGILTPEEGISGFSNPATITILGLFFIARALERTGIIRSLGDVMLKISSKKQVPIVMLIMGITAVTSAFINTTAVVIVFLPVVMSIGKARNISPTVLLMPLSFGAIIGGASTTIGTSTNLIISDVAKNSGIGALGVFEFTGIGLVLFALIVPYMAVSSVFLLKGRKKEKELIEGYNIKHYFTEIVLEKNCSWIGKEIENIEAIRLYEIDIIEIVRGEESSLDFYRTERLREGDTLLIRINAQNLIELKQVRGISISDKMNIQDRDLIRKGLTLIEVMINTNSALIGKNVLEVDFKEKYNTNVLGLMTNRPQLKPSRMKETSLRFGDTLLVETIDENKHVFYENKDFIVLHEFKPPRSDTRKAWTAAATVLAVIVLAATGILPILVAVLAGVAVLFLTGCVNVNEAYQAVEWKIIFLLAGLIPLGLALEQTGLSANLAGWLGSMVSGLPTFWALFCLYMATTLLTSVIYNNATAIILAPVMVSLAPAVDVEPQAMLALTMFAANCCYLTPIGYQTNLLIYGPGQYKFTDFLKVGGPLCVLLGLACSLLLMWF